MPFKNDAGLPTSARRGDDLITDFGVAGDFCRSPPPPPRVEDPPKCLIRPFPMPSTALGIPITRHARPYPRHRSERTADRGGAALRRKPMAWRATSNAFVWSSFPMNEWSSVPGRVSTVSLVLLTASPVR